MKKDKHKNYVNLMYFIKMFEKFRIYNFKKQREYFLRRNKNMLKQR